MALVELYRATGDRALPRAWPAASSTGAGTGCSAPDRFGAGVLPGPRAGARGDRGRRATPSAQLYLDCGAVDVAMETGDTELLAAVRRRWHDMVATQMYLTGGVGARHHDEAFGDPFELPPDRAYAETCAAIASVMSPGGCCWPPATRATPT